tara:strand:+ start:1328 stop:1801 length:474 start_codon:yes stop_codon:yes gene_type:complete
MLIQFKEYLTFETIFLWSSFGILPFWLMLAFIPNSRITQIFVNSIIIPLILGSAYVYVGYQAFLLDEPIINFFKFSLNLDDLYTLFSNEGFLLIFWLHFLVLNLFVGSWISRDGVKYGISKAIVLPALLLVYFFGPLGLVFYWFIRIFYSKKLGFHD